MSLVRRRKKALWIIIAAAGATGSASTAPTTGLEIPKQAAVGLGDLALLGSIYNIYFDEEPDQDSMIEMLKEAGVLLAVGGGFAYGSVKLTEAVLAEILNFVPVVGWLVSGAITASVTTTVGSLWCWACDQALRRGTNPVAEIQAMLSLSNLARDHSPEPLGIA
jgi:uncharacterized protein (DUF697 family)